MIIMVNIYCLELIFISLNTVQQQKLMKKVILIEILSLNKKDKGHQKKKLNCTFIRIKTSKKNFDVYYEASRIQTFINQFKDNKNKGLKDKIKKLNLQLASLGVKNNDVNDKKINNTVTAKIYFIKNRPIVLLLILHFL